MAPKVVVITGCSTGIGLETAVLLAEDADSRFKVFATMRNLAKKAQLEIAAGATLDKTLFVRQLDVTKKDSVEEFMEKMNRDEGGVDILINNAGIGQGGTIENVTMEQIRAVFETNVFGLIRLTQAVIPGMKAKKSGHIISVTSAAGLIGVPFAEIYVASKFAVEGFSESIAPLLQQFNVRVSAIEPGPVATAFLTNIGENKTGEYGSTSKISVDPNTDDLTNELRMTSQASSKKNLAPLVQTGKDIACIIRDAILSDKPHLHYQTSDAMKAIAAAKFTDPTGDSVVQTIAAQSGWNK